MTPGESPIEARIAELRENVFADPAQLSQIEKQWRAGKLSDAEARRQIARVAHELSVRPVDLSPRELADEWQALGELLEESENRWKKRASLQFFIGFTALPTVVFGALASLFFGWQRAEGAPVVATLLGGCLAAMAVHSFLVLRIHQQAGLAAERLSEKRAGALFLKLAVSRDEPAEAARLLEAGTSMFLGHHAPATLPLESGDFSLPKP